MSIELLESAQTISLFSDYRYISEKYVNLLPDDREEKMKHAHEIYGMLQNAYKDQGGLIGGGFESPEDMIDKIPMWKIHKSNGKIKSVALYKDSNGRKRVAVATDGTPEGKESATRIMRDDLSKNRANMEVSGKSLSVMKKLVDVHSLSKSFEDAAGYHASLGNEIGKPQGDDPEILRHPELKDRFYTRKIGPITKTKILLGNSKPLITEATEEDRRNASLSNFTRGYKMMGDWMINPNVHPAGQARVRRPEFTSDDWDTLHQKSLDAIKKHNVPSGYHVMFSRKMDQGYVTHVDHPSKTLNIVTVLPRGKYHASKPGDGRIIFESISFKVVDLD